MNIHEVFEEYKEFIDLIEDPKLKSTIASFIFVGVCLKLGMSKEQIMEALENENL